MIISAIVAATENNVIGRDNDIPWYLSDDLKFFKKTTLNHHIIMGRNTFQSIGRPLPKRTNIVLTRQSFFVASGCLIAHSVEEALEMAEQNGETEAFIIGGGTIYEQSWEFLDRIYFTRVHTTLEGTVFFPEIDETQWVCSSETPHKASPKNDFDFTIKVFERKT